MSWTAPGALLLAATVNWLSIGRSNLADIPLPNSAAREDTAKFLQVRKVHENT